MNFESIPVYWHWIIIVSLILVGMSNYDTNAGDTLMSAITETTLNFDSSLSDYTDTFMINKQAGMTKGEYFFGMLTILAHLMIFVYIFMISYYVLSGMSFGSGIFYTSILVMALHLIYFIFINDVGLSMDTFLDALPFTGVLHLLKALFTNTELFKMDNLIETARDNVVDTVTNINESITQNFDFDMS